MVEGDDVTPPVLIYSWFDTTCPYAVRCPILACNLPLIGQVDRIASQLLAMPDEHRVLIYGGADAMLFGHPDDQLAGGRVSAWHPAGVLQAGAEWYAFHEAIHKRGVTIDRAALDGESDPNPWSADYDAATIAADLRYPEAVRRYGFPADPTTNNFETTYVALAAFARRGAHEASVLTDAITRFNPGCVWSDWQQSPVSPHDAQTVRENNGHPQPYPGTGAPVNSPAWYGSTGAIRRRADGQLTANDGEPLTGDQIICWQRNTAAASLRADPTAPVMPWRSSRRWGPAMSGAQNTALTIHALMLGGRIYHWSGLDRDNPVEAVEAAEDDASLTRACETYLSIARGAEFVRPIGANLIRKDTTVYAASAAKFSDGGIRGVVTWADHATAKQSAAVWLGSGLTVRVRRQGNEPYTTFEVA